MACLIQEFISDMGVWGNNTIVPVAEERFDWSFNDADLPVDTWKIMMYSEILDYHNVDAAQPTEENGQPIACLIQEFISDMGVWGNNTIVPVAEERFDWSFNDADLPVDTWKIMMYSEILDYHNVDAAQPTEENGSQ